MDQDARSLSSNKEELCKWGHCIENIGEEDLVFLELFAFPDFEDISLNNWLRSMPVQVAVAHTNLSPEEIGVIPPKANKPVG
jgi:oxalate decarboxylase